MRTTNITGGWFCQYRQSAIHSGRIFMRNVIHDYGQQGMQCCCWSGYILISLITWMFSVLYEPLLGLCIRIRVLNGVADHTITESWQITTSWTTMYSKLSFAPKTSRWPFTANCKWSDMIRVQIISASFRRGWQDSIFEKWWESWWECPWYSKVVTLLVK
jgi:hypothetical protein